MTTVHVASLSVVTSFFESVAVNLIHLEKAFKPKPEVTALISWMSE